MQVEEAIKEWDGASWFPRGDDSYPKRTPKHISFCPKIELSHDGDPSNIEHPRRMLANYLRRIANHLEA
jgi:hypothetical protein